MSDIVERLRKLAGPDGDNDVEGGWALDAAEEIERLREELKDCHEYAHELLLRDTSAADEIERLRAENQQLRREKEQYQL